jgi:maltooligosyltrehalose trehalohydrolase
VTSIDAAGTADALGAGRLGATPLDEEQTRFEVWAPRASDVEVVLTADGAADQRVEPLQRFEDGRHLGVIDDVGPGTRYRYRLHRDSGPPIDRPDPASRWQPDGVHGPSAVDDPAAFGWTDAGFSSPPLHEQVLYELHVGTFSPEGTFDGAIGQLDHLVDLGITTIELMPVWQFPGGRNWGYDGVLPSAVQDTYGGPDGLRRLVDAAHGRGLGVILDVVYNHLGPEGNHLADLGPYTTERYATPWGPAVNVDGPDSDQVRRWIVESAVGFVRDHHLDGFRLDAVHGIIDTSATHLLEELTAAVHAEGERQGKHVDVIAESDLCDPRLLRAPTQGGYGLDAQWADEVHHTVHVALTGERDGYYRDHEGLQDLEPILRDRFLYAGRYSPYRRRTIGRPAPDLPYDRFVACVQNHDQVGNRMLGERLTDLTDAAGRRFAAAFLLSAPFVPMLFMGEEYAEPAPFLYFVSHTEPALIEAVRTGRREEFAYFAHQGEAPDPQDPATFERSRIDVGLARQPGEHADTFTLYRTLLRMRRALPLLADPTAPDPQVVTVPGRQAVAWQRRRGDDAVLVVANAEPSDATIDVPATSAPGPARDSDVASDARAANGAWHVVLDTADPRFGGAGPSPVAQPREGGTLRCIVPARTVLVLSSRPVDLYATSTSLGTP